MRRLFVMAAVAVLIAGSPAAYAQERGAGADRFEVTGFPVGGVFFGSLADRIGRKPTMALTILFYSVFSGLTYFATELWQVAVLRFLVALGVGGLGGDAVPGSGLAGNRAGQPQPGPAFLQGDAGQQAGVANDGVAASHAVSFRASPQRGAVGRRVVAV